MVISGYFACDMQSASTADEFQIICDYTLSIEERWPVFNAVWLRTCHTGYAQVVKRVLKKFYDEDSLSLEALLRINSKLFATPDDTSYEAILDEAKILCRLENICTDINKDVIDGTMELLPRSRLVIGLPQFHLVRSSEDVQRIAGTLGKRATNLDEYTNICRDIFDGYKRFGAVAFKDQSAYIRSLEFDNPTRADAEAVFNWFIEDPRKSLSCPDGLKPLSDYLFHEFMRMARDMDMPVQIHTGHLTAMYNDIRLSNAVHLVRMLELHKDVRFDLFHANWPYNNELLFLAKSYPNVCVNFCWANIIDPIYCQQLFKQMLSSVPHSKIHGFGSDYVGNTDKAWAHATIARDNIAIALSDMVSMDYFGIKDAKDVAYAWLFGNANNYYRLELDPH